CRELRTAPPSGPLLREHLRETEEVRVEAVSCGCKVATFLKARDTFLAKGLAKRRNETRDLRSRRLLGTEVLLGQVGEGNEFLVFVDQNRLLQDGGGGDPGVGDRKTP